MSTGGTDINRNALQKISYGLYVICSKDNNRFNGQIANAVFQVTAEPPTIAVSINKENCTHEYIEKSKIFTVSILSEETPMNFIGTFGFQCGRTIDKFKDVTYTVGKTTAPIVTQNSIAYLEANVTKNIDVGTHTIFIGEIIDAEILTDETPLTYEYYHRIKGGYAPKTAQTYYKETKHEKKNKEEVKKKMDSYVCTVCGYVYDPEKGDPDNGVEPGTKFNDVPDDWVCPVCGAGKEEFEME